MDEVLVHFRLVGIEARALRALSDNEQRKPRDQVRYILRRELERLGLLQPSPNQQLREAANEKPK